MTGSPGPEEPCPTRSSECSIKMNPSTDIQSAMRGSAHCRSTSRPTAVILPSRSKPVGCWDRLRLVANRIRRALSSLWCPKLYSDSEIEARRARRDGTPVLLSYKPLPEFDVIAPPALTNSGGVRLSQRRLPELPGPSRIFSRPTSPLPRSPSPMPHCSHFDPGYLFGPRSSSPRDSGNDSSMCVDEVLRGRGENDSDDSTPPASLIESAATSSIGPSDEIPAGYEEPISRSSSSPGGAESPVWKSWVPSHVYEPMNETPPLVSPSMVIEAIRTMRRRIERSRSLSPVSESSGWSVGGESVDASTQTDWEDSPALSDRGASTQSDASTQTDAVSLENAATQADTRYNPLTGRWSRPGQARKSTIRSAMPPYVTRIRLNGDGTFAILGTSSDDECGNGDTIVETNLGVI